MDVCDRVPLLAAGLYIEPALHPKPGAVTRLESHSDKTLLDFLFHASKASHVLVRACRVGAEGGECPRVVRDGLRLYLKVAEEIRRNIAFGSFLLLLPLAGALPRAHRRPEVLAIEATRLALNCTGTEETSLYIKIMNVLKPSYLGSYEGPSVDVTKPPEGKMPPFRELLRSASWDLVHSEITESYPRTLEAYSIISERMTQGSDLEEASLWALLYGLAYWGDTLIYHKYGSRAYAQSISEAMYALRMAERHGVRSALEWLDSLWRPRGWNPGAVLDVLATGIGLIMFYQGYDPG